MQIFMPTLRFCLFVVREKVGFKRTSGSSCCKPHHSASLIPGKMYPNEYVNTSLGRFLRLLQACRVAAVPDDGNTERNRLLLLRSHVLSDGRVTRGKTSGKKGFKGGSEVKDACEACNEATDGKCRASNLFDLVCVIGSEIVIGLALILEQLFCKTVFKRETVHYILRCVSEMTKRSRTLRSL